MTITPLRWHELATIAKRSLERSKEGIMSRKTLIALAMAALAAPLPVAAQTSGGGWSFSVMPYLWLPSIDGALRFGPPPPGGVSANVGTDPDSYLDSLDFALMLTGTARKDRWVLGSDLIYLHFSNTDAKVKSVDHNLGRARSPCRPRPVRRSAWT
jgi:hypothetical protein